jgi:signal transduction histidine kinase
MVEVDYRQIEKAFVNIFEHSVRAMHEGGDLYLETENVLFDEEPPGPIGTDEGRYVRFSMPESNVGIDEESCIRIFDPYYIFGEMDTGSKSGLAAVFGIIKNHEGSIEVSSDIGTGTTFNIYLPAHQSEK